MRAFVTGGTGFLGGHLVAGLRGRGDEVVALVRSPEKAAALRALGCELVEGGLEGAGPLLDGVRGCDAAFHVAGVYKVGIPRSERPAMYEANVRGTARVIDACVEAGVKRIVYVSTIGAFGDTHGKVVDERYRHPGTRYLSYYEESKALAHRVAEERARAGAPVVIVQPGGVYGRHVRRGRAHRPAPVGEAPRPRVPRHGLQLGPRRRRDPGDPPGPRSRPNRGVLRAGGQLGTLGDMIDTVARLAGRRPPRATLPPWLVKAGSPFGPAVGRLMRVGPNLAESIRAADGVTYWATDRKARDELGYAPRDLETGIRDTLAAT